MSRPHRHEPAHTNERAWPAFVARYRVGDVADGEVVSVVPFGAFIRIDDVDGFTPKASWSVLPELGTRVRVRIDAIDSDQRRFALAPA